LILCPARQSPRGDAIDPVISASWSLSRVKSMGIQCALYHSTVDDSSERAETRATFRKRAEECLRLSRELPNLEQKFLVLGMANAWILLAELAEKLPVG
jgi:hypothetical protein